MGPILIFDKSTLESLNPDEAMWLDVFFNSNITPLFFVETLADLEKAVHGGRTPEDVVGNLAYKTPDMNSRPNVHHASLLATELTGASEIDMRYGRPIISGGQAVELGGKTGIIFRQAPEEEALDRWQNGEFLELERSIAKAWRRALSNINLEETYQRFQSFYPLGKPRTFADVKRFVDFYIDGPDQARVLMFGLSLLGVPPRHHEQVMARWIAAGRPPVRQFIPYFTHILSVDLFFCLTIAADLIGRGRPSHKIDVAYLYYLPFCMVFTSNDKLHASIAPFFLQENQSFVLGSELKADLGKLDTHFDALPDETKRQGVTTFASYPPADDSFLITRLFDKHLAPTWRDQIDRKPDLGSDAQHIIEQMHQFEEEGVPVPDSQISSDEADHVVIKRMVRAQKGKWLRFPPEVPNKARSQEREPKDTTPEPSEGIAGL